jgi:uncharacterized membrane protein
MAGQTIAALTLHILAAVVWVGGMFFALFVLRPSAGALDPPVRVAQWDRVFRRFFAWVWISVLLLLATGYWMVSVRFGGFAGLPIYVNIMQGLGWIMILLYLHLWFAPYRRFKAAVAAGDVPAAARALNGIRIVVSTNLAIGLIVIAVAATGRFWS